MFFLKETFLKGLCGATLCGGVAYTGFHFKGQVGKFVSDTFFPESEQDLLDGVGLDCQGWENNPNGSVCTKKNGAEKIKIKKEDGTSIEINEIPASGGGKIKLYKVQDSDGYHRNLKFVIEDGDVGSETNKLEQFETYEIAKENKGFYLSRKKKALDEKKRILGLHEECNLPTDSENPSQCNELDLEKIKGLAFDARGEGSPTLTESTKVNLTITKLDGNNSNFPLGYKFAFQGNGSDATLTWSGNNKTITFKNGQDTEYRILMRDGNQLTLEEAWDQNTLTSNVGLTCTGGNPSLTNGIECSKKDGAAEIKVKQGDSTFNVSTISDGKIKLYRAESTNGYFKNLKFVIEDGDINGPSGSSNKLEQFETYEIKKDEGSQTWYLTRKSNSREYKKKLLGLPDDCTLPENNGPNTCNVNPSNVNNINFDGKTSATLSGNGTLKIEIASSADATDFPYGFKFTLTPTNGNLTINRSSGSLTVKANKGEEFKIKKSGSSLTLEEAWTLDTLTKKVGLSCTGTPTENDGVQCSKGSTDIKVKQGNSTFNVSNVTEGKIKVYKDDGTGNYNKDFKFVIEDNDISSGNSNKLEEFETYEIKKDGNEWKLTRKNEAKEFIKKALGLDHCNFPTNGGQQDGCDIASDKFKKVKFDGISEDVANGPVGTKLKISKVSGDNTFGKFGYKFVLESTNDAKISDTLTIMGNTNTEFKIKKDVSDNKALTLEKAWSVTTLGEKINLTCTTADPKQCSLGNSINVWNDNSNSVTNSGYQNGDSTKKISYEEGQGNYNQGIKFYVTEGNEIQLNGGTTSGSVEKIEKCEGSGPSYEIKEVGGTWYLAKVASAGGAGGVPGG